MQTTLVLPAPALNLSETYVYPNPFKPGSGSVFDAPKIVFKKLTDRATIKVYSYAGQLVATLHKTDTSVDYYEWDAKNETGEYVASGVYVYLITNTSGEKISGKFGIIR